MQWSVAPTEAAPPRYLVALAQANQPGFLPSYETRKSGTPFDLVMAGTAFTYDNAVAALALIATGRRQQAQQIVDALVTAQNSDRFWKDGRLRNAYRSGSKKEAQVALPGFWDNKANRWSEDEFQVSTHTGNVAWAMLALLGYYDSYGGQQYLQAAVRLGEWVENNCRDNRGNGGYTGGLSGWEPSPAKLTYKSTEHNLDLYAAFERLALDTGNRVWHERALYALRFLDSMWDPREGKFWTGTALDGIAINRSVIPLDVQAWAPLALGKRGKPYLRALTYAQSHHRVANGFDFNTDRDGIWYEGTAQMAVAYQYTGQPIKARPLLATLAAARNPAGGLPAANRNGLTTGFQLSDGQPWLYFKRLHVGATAWADLAALGRNPFWLGRNEL
ncbi:MAG: hypothetical protein H7Y37_08225 [Anaerolineae bacterium]|nr:hypothetical protein [Gloeobacterales cyanobacterium ES-bin-313]